MIIAVTYEKGKVFQHFGHTKQLKIYEIEDNNIKQEGLEKSNIKFYGGVLGDADNTVKNLLNKKLKYNENAHCEYHKHNEHSCNEHKCNEDKHGCSGNETE